MSRCIQLAKNGLGTTYPNPLVGSVIVYKERIIGEGWHYKAGEAHAEVNAISQAMSYIEQYQLIEKEVFEEATIYVSLEPCSHWGKTPPCADLISTKGIKNVVIGSTDPNPKVAGKGVLKLTENGCVVTLGVLEAKCDALNKRFFTFQNKKRPYIFLKWAETADGFIAPESKKNKKPVWISNEISRQFTHKMRAKEQAILVGFNTVMEDNPSLTTRDWAGTSPMRMVIDAKLKIPEKAAIFNEQSTTLLINSKKEGKIGHLEYLKVDITQNVPQQICDLFFQKEIQSLIVEGGSRTLQYFIDANLWDEAIVFKGTSTFKNGIKAPILSEKISQEELLGTDRRITYINKSL